MKIAIATFITGMIVSLPLVAAESRPDPIADPIPEKIQKGDISVALQDFVQIPESQDSAMPERTNVAHARIQFMTPLPDGSGRLVVNDLRGLLYLIPETGGGTSREIFRIGQFAPNHNFGTIAFNPHAESGSADYGMLYASMGDGGGANDPMEYGQSTFEPMSGIFRIDPLGGEGDSAYGIPADNPFVSSSDFAPETWAYGLRHPQAFSFDIDGTMYICDIGQTQIEEVNIGVAGANYGWRVREGTFATAFGLGGVRPNPVYPRPEDDQEYTYPVAQFDHDEGNAISSGFVYRGSAVPVLQEKFVFTDMVTGRVFYIDTDNLEPDNPATILELRIEFFGFERNIADAIGFPNTYSRGNRAGLRLGIDSEGELYFLTKGDGKIRKMVPAS